MSREREWSPGKEEEHVELNLLCSHMLARAGRWRNGSLPRCVRVCCCSSTYPAPWFGACLLCLFALTRVVTPGSGIVLAAGTCRASLQIALGRRRAVVVVNTRVCWRDGISTKREGAVPNSAAPVLLWQCNLCVFGQGFGQKSGIFGAGWPGGRSCCS